MQQTIEQHGVTVGKDKTVTVIRGRIGGVMFKIVPLQRYPPSPSAPGCPELAFERHPLLSGARNRIGKVFTGHKSPLRFIVWRQAGLPICAGQ